jgi:hypothetical protein
MSFKSWQDADNRLRTNEAKLTPQEVRDLMPHMNQISEVGMRRLKAELALQNIEAVQTFETSSSNLTKWVIGLTVALVVLTVVIAVFTVILARAKVTASRAGDEMPLRVRALEIIDSAGVARMRLGAPVPDPATGGKLSPRKSPLNGIQINDAKGDEFGGLGMLDDGSMIFCFDSRTSEATCMYSLTNAGRGFSVTDDQGKDRAVMEISQDKSVSVSINDENGKPRATIRIGSGAAPELRLRAPDGKLIWAAPKSK